MHEIETKILGIDVKEILEKLTNLGAKKKQDVLLKVDWFAMPEHDTKNLPWFLRTRSYSDGKIEVTFKSDPKVVGTVRKVNEINVMVDDHEKIKMLFEAIGLITYAHQEKKRLSFELDEVFFDIDTYPGMDPYLEIEADSEEKINEMAEKLGLSKHERWNHGERTLISEKFRLNWFDMRF